MNITQRKSIIRTIRDNDHDFRMIDGLVVVPRAGFEINHACPAGYKQVIGECLANGWLRPVAYVKDYELMWDQLNV